MIPADIAWHCRIVRQGLLAELAVGTPGCPLDLRSPAGKVVLLADHGAVGQRPDELPTLEGAVRDSVGLSWDGVRQIVHKNTPFCTFACCTIGGSSLSGFYKLSQLGRGRPQRSLSPVLYDRNVT